MREEEAAPTRTNTHRVQHLQHFVLLAGIQSVNDHSHTRLVLREAVDGFGHFGH